MPVPVAEDPVKLPPVILMPSNRTVALPPPWPKGQNTLVTLAAPATVQWVVGSYGVFVGSSSSPSGSSGLKSGGRSHFTTSPLLGTIDAEAVKVQPAPSTKVLGVVRGSALIVA